MTTLRSGSLEDGEIIIMQVCGLSCGGFWCCLHAEEPHCGTGHSQGTTMAFAALSSMPGLQEKVRCIRHTY